MKRSKIKKFWDRCVQNVKNAWNKVKIFVCTQGTIMNLKGSMSTEVARNELLFYRNINCIISSNGFLYGAGIHSN